MLSINGTTNYSTARIDGKIIIDQSAEIAQLQFDTQAISYNDVTNTTNIDSNVSITGATQFVGGLQGPLDISGNVSLKGDLVIYDKTSPTPNPYTLKTQAQNFEFHYNNGTDYTIYDVSMNTTPQMNWNYPMRFKNLCYFYNNAYMDDGKSLFLGGNMTGTLGARLTYSTTTKILNILSGTSIGSQTSIYLQTNDSVGTPYIITIDPTTVTLPQNLSIPSYSNVTTALNTLYTRTTNQSWTSNNTSFATDYLQVGISNPGTSTPIQIWGKQVNGINVTRNGIMLTSPLAGGSSPSSVAMGFVNTTDNVFDLGINCGNVAKTRNTASQGVQFRFDSRNIYDVFQIQTVEQVNGTVRNALNCNHLGQCQIPVRLDLLSGANMTQAGTGIISQSGTGTNALKTTSITGDLSVSGNLTLGGSYTPTSITTNTLVVNTSVNGNGSGQFPVNCDISIGNDKVILQNPASTSAFVNFLGKTTIQTSFGASAQSGLIVKDTVNSRNLNVVPNSSAGSYNSSNQAGDVVIFASGSAVDTQPLNITTWSNTKVGVRIEPTRTTVNFGDGTSMDSAEQIQREPSDADVLSLESEKNVVATTYDLCGLANINTVALTGSTGYFHPVYLTAGTNCAGICIFKSATAVVNCYVALYNKGFSSLRLGVSALTSVPTGSAVQFIPFTASYTIPTSGLFYVAIIPSGTLNMVGIAANSYLNHAYTTTTNGTLNRRSQSGAMTAFTNSILTTQVFSAINTMIYMGVYTV